MRAWRLARRVAKPFAHVILPLALRRMLPPLGNQWIISIKDTSLFIVIGVAELTRQGQGDHRGQLPARWKSGAP